MIERYSVPAIENIWSRENRYRIYLLIEEKVNDALQEHFIIEHNRMHPTGLPVGMVMELADKIEVETRHDILAFVFAVEKLCEKECGTDCKWIHYGLTSSDLLDSATAIQVRDSLLFLHLEVMKLIAVIEDRANWEKDQQIMARTHGKHAMKVSLSEIFASWARQINNHLGDLVRICVPGKLSGAVGDNRVIPYPIQKKIADRLGMQLDYHATQVVQREFYAELIWRLAIYTKTLEKFALQIRLWQQSGIEEIEEPFYEGQGGSSAMPHKHNPIMCENITGLSRVISSYVPMALDNVPLWGHRDLTHSSTERIMLPDVFNLVAFVTDRMNKVIHGLKVNHSLIDSHLIESDSQEEMLHMIKDKGFSRYDAYRATQEQHNEDSSFRATVR